MKKSTTGTIALLAGVFIAHSQGTVSFADFYSGGNYVAVEYYGQSVGGTAAHTGTYNDIHAGGDWTVQLYGAPGANQPLSSLVPVVLDGTANRPVLATLAGGGEGVYLGQWLSTAVGDIPGTTGANQPATVAVAAWYNYSGTITTLKAAEDYDFPNGWSATGNVITGGFQEGNHPPLLPTELPQLGNGIINMTGFLGIIPEPSTIALGVMGASAFLMRLRRKE